MIENYEGSDSDEGFKRMNRFLDFIRDLWIKLAIHYGIYVEAE